jgi:hypothetical protein
VTLLAVVPALLVLSASFAASEPWDYRCKSALSEIESAADDAQGAQRNIENSHERYRQAVDEYNNCRSYPQIYDLMRDGCQSQRWDADSARSDAQSDLSTFNSRMRSLADAFEDAASSCGGSQARGAAPSRACRLIKAMKARSNEEQALAFCQRVGVTESEFRRCMQ